MDLAGINSLESLGSLLNTLSISGGFTANANDILNDSSNYYLGGMNAKIDQINEQLTGGVQGSGILYEISPVAAPGLSQPYHAEAVGAPIGVSTSNLVKSVLNAGGLNIEETEATKEFNREMINRLNEKGWNANNSALIRQKEVAGENKLVTSVNKDFIDDVLNIANDLGAYNDGTAVPFISQGNVLPAGTEYGLTPRETIAKAYSIANNFGYSTIASEIQTFGARITNDFLDDIHTYCFVHLNGSYNTATIYCVRPRTNVSFNRYSSINNTTLKQVNLEIYAVCDYSWQARGLNITDRNVGLSCGANERSSIVIDNGVRISPAINGITKQPGASIPSFTTTKPSETIGNWINTLTTIKGIIKGDTGELIDTITNMLDLVIDVTDKSTATLDQSTAISGDTTADIAASISSLVQAIGGLLKTSSGVSLGPLQIIETPTGHVPIADYVPSEASHSLYTVYKPTDLQLNNIGEQLWNPSILDVITQIFTNNPLDAIISCHDLYIPVEVAGSKVVRMGAVPLENAGMVDYVRYRTAVLDCGSCRVPEYYGNVLDYYPYTRLAIYLPYIGFRSLDVSECMASVLNVHYNIDVFTGDCLAYVEVNKEGSRILSYTFEGNCAIQIPLTGRDRTAILGMAVDTLIGLDKAVSVGSMGGVSVDKNGINNTIWNGLSRTGNGGTMQQVMHSGAMGGNSGMLGPRYPFVVVTHQKSYTCDFNKLAGLPNYTRTKLQGLSGLTICESIRLENIDCTTEEKQMIAAELLNGVIL